MCMNEQSTTDAVKHTPGPWKAFQRASELGSNYWRIRTTPDPNDGDTLHGYCGETVARLIESAPEQAATIARLEARLAAFEQLRAAAEAVQVTIRHIDTSEVDGDGAKKLLDTALAALPPASEKGGA